MADAKTPATASPAMPDDSQPQAEASGPGELLAAARRSRELSLDEVGDSLNLAAGRVALIEADDYAALPAAAFTQGYIRNYAKLVGLDADAMVSAYQRKAGVPMVAWNLPKRAALINFADLMERHPGLLLGGVVAAVGLLVLIVLVSVWPASDSLETDVDAGHDAGHEVATVIDSPAGDSAAPAATLPTLQEEPATRLASPASPAVGANRNAAPAPGSVEIPNLQAIDPEAIDPDDPLAHLPIAQTYPSDSVAAPAEIARLDSGPRIARRVTPAGNDVIDLNFSADCWLEVRGQDEALLYSNLGRAGSSLELIGAGPFRLLLGYAPGVQLEFNGERIMLAQFTRRDVARLVLTRQ